MDTSTPMGWWQFQNSLASRLASLMQMMRRTLTIWCVGSIVHLVFAFLNFFLQRCFVRGISLSKTILLQMMRRTLTIWMTAMCGREGCNQAVHQPQVSPCFYPAPIIIARASPLLVVIIAKSQLPDRGRCSCVKNCDGQFIVNFSLDFNGQRWHINERGVKNIMQTKSTLSTTYLHLY